MLNKDRLGAAAQPWRWAFAPDNRYYANTNLTSLGFLICALFGALLVILSDAQTLPNALEARRLIAGFSFACLATSLLLHSIRPAVLMVSISLFGAGGSILWLDFSAQADGPLLSNLLISLILCSFGGTALINYLPISQLTSVRLNLFGGLSAATMLMAFWLYPELDFMPKDRMFLALTAFVFTGSIILSAIPVRIVSLLISLVLACLMIRLATGPAGYPLVFGSPVMDQALVHIGNMAMWAVCYTFPLSLLLAKR